MGAGCLHFCQNSMKIAVATIDVGQPQATERKHLSMYCTNNQLRCMHVSQRVLYNQPPLYACISAGTVQLASSVCMHLSWYCTTSLTVCMHLSRYCTTSLTVALLTSLVLSLIYAQWRNRDHSKQEIIEFNDLFREPILLHAMWSHLILCKARPQIAEGVPYHYGIRRLTTMPPLHPSQPTSSLHFFLRSTLALFSKLKSLNCHVPHNASQSTRSIHTSFPSRMLHALPIHFF
jgi:hypothetical protein